MYVLLQIETTGAQAVQDAAASKASVPVAEAVKNAQEQVAAKSGGSLTPAAQEAIADAVYK
jgi:hypothetical protein